MKLFSQVVLFLFGVYVIYQGYTTYTFSARSPDGSMGISKFIWLFIPATDFHLHTYGLIFIGIGILFIVASFILYRFSLKRSKAVQVGV